MAECKDCVHNKVCSEVNSLKCRKDFIWYDAKSGCPYYTADVVPKSEVERLQAELEDKQFRCDSCDRIGLTHSEHIYCIKQAKAEVAREILRRLRK